MTRVVVTVLGVVGWAGAIALVLRWRSTRRVPRPADPADASTGTRIARATARVSGSVAGALVAGVLVPGLGGRLMMRVLAATSSDAAQGRITDAEEVVGEVTVDGTIGLVLFVGGFGGLAGLAFYAVLRRWLPDRSLIAGLVTAGIGAGLLARPSGLLEPENPDFAILTPTWLALALAVGLIVTFGLVAAVLIDRWSASWPLPGRSVKGVAGVLPLAPLLLAVTPGLAVLGAIGFTAAVQPAVAGGWLRPVDRVLRVVVLIAAAAGVVWLGVSVVEIAQA